MCTDTRAIAAGNAFVALSGERFDGHDHVAAAIERGASMLIVSRTVSAPARVSVIQVDDTTRALGDLARAHRRRWSARASGASNVVIAITGSAGKTTTRRAIASLLTELGARVHATTGNLNNAIGIPMVLFGLTDAHDTAVIEVGTSSPGEIAYGASITAPDVAVLTMVAAAHSEGLGSIADIAREKGALFEALDPSGIAIANGDDAFAVAQLVRSRAGRWIRYGTHEGADVRVLGRASRGLGGSRIELSLHGTARRGSSELPSAPASLEVETPLLGAAGTYATAAAVATASALHPNGLSSRAVTAAFATLSEAETGRLAPRTLEDGTIVLDDSYNANRVSMIAGIETAAELAAQLGRRLVLVLGEMRELGPLSAEEHDLVGQAAARAKPALLIAVTGDASRIQRVAKAAGIDTRFVSDAEAAAALLRESLRPGDVVLVKASRSIGLDRVARALVSGDVR